MEWHFQIWQKAQSFLGQDEKLEEWSIYNEIGRILGKVILRIEQLSLEGKGIESFSFFEYRRSHIDSHKAD